MCAPYVEARPKGGARAEKEIGEKAQKIIRYQIVSTYFLHGAFKVLFFGLKTCLQPSFGLIMCTLAPSLNTLKTVYIICYAGTKKKVANLRGLQARSGEANLKYSTPIKLSCFQGYETLSDLPYIQNIQASISHTSSYAPDFPLSGRVQRLYKSFAGNI